MKIIQIFAKDFPENKEVTFTFQSDYYYDVQVIKKDTNKGWIFDWSLKAFPTTFTKCINENLFEDHKENAKYYIIVNDEEREIGHLVVGKQEWNNVTRIWDIAIDKQFHHQGFGTKLMAFAEIKAKEWQSRALVLECQSSNYNAIQFYLKCGFSLTGFDLIGYSNQDCRKHDIRLEMSKLLE
ncbi:MAG: GNAT family N-acetyltransferase [Promethearchaeota archaeon]